MKESWATFNECYAYLDEAVLCGYGYGRARNFGLAGYGTGMISNVGSKSKKFFMPDPKQVQGLYKSVSKRNTL